MFQFTYAPGRIIVDDPIIISTLFVDLNNIMQLWENELFFQLSWILHLLTSTTFWPCTCLC